MWWQRCRKARWCCRGSTPISTRRPGRSIGGIRDARADSPSIPPRAIRNMPCMRCSMRFGIGRGDVEILGPPAPHGRDVLLSEAMRPSNATAQWHDRLGQPEIAAKIADGMKNLAVDRGAQSGNGGAGDRDRHARGAHLQKSAALVTPDRALARRVMAALARWNLDFDDSGGDALMETSAGIFARLAAEAVAKGLEPPTLLALLKHPLCRLGGAPGACTRDRNTRTGAAARDAPASRKRGPGARFRALSRRARKAARRRSILAAPCGEAGAAERERT